MSDVTVSFVTILTTVLWISIFIRALMSWVMPQETGGVARVLRDITEPVLSPIRRVLPPLGGLDLSPLVAIILINVLQKVLVSVLSGTA